jgi:ribosomal protein S18 acetylase RimI-like enzyme
MTEAFVIRTAASGDYAEVAALLAEVDELHRVQLPWLFRVPAVDPRPREFFEQVMAADSSTIFVADAGSIVGTAKVLVRSAPEFAVFIPQSWGVLDNIAVAETWRRRGVGPALTRAAETWARQQHVKWIELGVYEFNDEARAFYEALGYLPVSTKLRKSLVPAD